MEAISVLDNAIACGFLKDKHWSKKGNKIVGSIIENSIKRISVKD